MGLPPVIIHCNGIFHHKPSSYWGISYNYHIYPILWKPCLKCDGKFSAPCALSVPCVPWFWAPPPWHSGLLVLTAKLLELLCKLYQIALYKVPSNYPIHDFSKCSHPIHDFSLQASLAYDCWAFKMLLLQVLKFIQTDRSIWPQVHEHKGVKQEKTYLWYLT